MPSLEYEIAIYTKAVQRLRAVPLFRLQPETQQAIQQRIAARAAQLERALAALHQSITNPLPVFFPSLRVEGGC